MAIGFVKSVLQENNVQKGTTGSAFHFLSNSPLFPISLGTTIIIPSYIIHIFNLFV